MMMAAWKIGPALAAGNSVVLKPSREAPADRAAPGRARARSRPAARACSTSCRATATRPARRSRCTWTSTAIAFTGSTRVGRRCSSTPGAVNLKRVCNELRRQVAPTSCSPTSPTSTRAARDRGGIDVLQPGRDRATRRRACSCTSAIADDSCDKVAGRWRRSTQPGDPLDADDRDGRASSTRRRCKHRAGLHRGRPRAKARRSPPAASRRARTAAAITSSRRCSTA